MADEGATRSKGKSSTQLSEQISELENDQSSLRTLSAHDSDLEKSAPGSEEKFNRLELKEGGELGAVVEENPASGKVDFTLSRKSPLCEREVSGCFMSIN